MTNWSIVIPFVMYLLGLLVFGYLASKKLDGLSDYLLGGRTIGSGVTALTLQSTSMSGFMFMGGPALAFQQGLWALWYAAGDFGGGLVNLSILGRNLRRVTEALGSLTPIEWLEDRYMHPSIRVAGATIAIVFLAAYVFAQFIAAGKAIESVMGLPFIYGLLIGAGVIVLYTFVGGYLAVAWTDAFQAIVMAVGINVILVAAILEVGGPGALITEIAAVDPTYLSIWGKGLAHAGEWGVVAGAVLIYSIGYMGLPHAVVRHLSMDEPDTAKGAAIWNVFYNTFFVYQPYILGLVAIVLLPNLSDPEMAIPRLATSLLPSVLAAVILAALMAAVMSTADSLLIMAGSILSRDVVQRFAADDLSDDQMFFWSRMLVLAIGVIGVIVAAVQPPGIFTLVVFAFGGLGTAFLVPNIAGIYWDRANWQGALTAMIGGAGTNIVWTVWNLQEVSAIHPFFAGLIVSAVLMIVVTLITEPPTKQVVSIVQRARRAETAPSGTIQKSTRSLAPEARSIGEYLAVDDTAAQVTETNSPAVNTQLADD
ncbi:sodium/proline symporter [Natronorubrum aibiense]|uniref:Sodium/solute symporter n=1 Tax=Natronorubrum aibiense TaxID=348826 RepID=A0A5P9P8X5_9EURY|nr:sodium/proline symporter [Natronorubrum aibiense]QFU84558.1 sodium/solute symporter [Natronorubrum aibiense]